jgi:hypothetical protein
MDQRTFSIDGSVMPMTNIFRFAVAFGNFQEALISYRVFQHGAASQFTPDLQVENRFWFLQHEARGFISSFSLCSLTHGHVLVPHCEQGEVL